MQYSAFRGWHGKPKTLTKGEITMTFAVRTNKGVAGYVMADSKWDAGEKLGLVKNPGDDFYVMGNATTKDEPIVLQELAELENFNQLRCNC